MKKLLPYIISFLIAFLIFNLYFILTATFDYSLISVFKINIEFYYDYFLEFSISRFQSLYPKYGILLFTIVKLYKIKFLLYIVFITFVISKSYSIPNIKKKYVFTVFLSFLILMFIELSLGQINNKINKQKKEKSNFLTLLQYEDLQLLQFTKSNKFGINIFIPDTSKFSIDGYQINNDGFRSKYKFDSLNIQNLKADNKVIMFVGDSYTEGCCAKPITNSFVDLIDLKENKASLNFGVSATDPLQYSLIIKHYLKNVKPDILIIPLCLSNDFMYLDRKPMPGKSLFFQTNYGFLSATLPISHPNYKNDTYFKNWEVAKKYYIENYSIYGSEPSKIKRWLLTHSEFHKQLLIQVQNIKNIYFTKVNLLKVYLKEVNTKITYKYLKQIKKTCESLSIPFLLIGAPSINDLDKNIELVNTNYRNQLNELEIFIPTNFVESDYISFQDDHFNNTGHQKFADYLLPLIDSTINYQTSSKLDSVN